MQTPKLSHTSYVLGKVSSVHAVPDAFGVRGPHRPVVAMQLLASRQSVAGSQLTAAHLDGWMQAPEPSHTSFVVSSPSSVQEVPTAVAALTVHWPVVGMQVLLSRQLVSTGQVMAPLHFDGWMQAPAPSHTSFVVASPSSAQGVPMGLRVGLLHSLLHAPLLLQ